MKDLFRLRAGRAVWFAFVFVLAGLLWPPTIFAHDTWLVPGNFRPAPGETVRVRLVTSEAFPEGESAVAPARIAQFFVRTTGGTQSVSGYRVESVDLVAEVVARFSGQAVLVAETKPYAFVLEPAVFNQYLQEEELEAILAARARRGQTDAPGRERYRKIAKAVLCAPVSGANRAGQTQALSMMPQGLWLEIVPFTDLCEVKVGDTVTFQVLFEGKPLAGVRLAAGYAGVTGHGYPVWLRTDAEGKAAVRFDRPGAWFVRTLHMVEARGQQESDWESAFSTFTFEVLPKAPGGDRSAAAAVRELLEMQAEAWNRGDLEGFLAGYWNSPNLTFAGAGGVTRGWAAVRERYRRNYPGRGAMGRLTFSDLEITELGPAAVFVLGRWQLERAEDRPAGVFTLIVQKFPEGWRIVHDHTSAFPANQQQ